MKRIGIITMHRVPNFGSALQAYALQKVITNLGYQSELIDYVCPNKYHKKQNGRKTKLKSHIAKLFNLTPYWRNYKRIKQFQRTFLITSKKTYQTKEALQKKPPQYDIYLTGSDQVWNPRYVKGDTSFLLAFVPEDRKKIAYSASFAASSIDSEYHNVYKSLLSSYKNISVRETSGVRVMKDLLQKDVQVTLDPTLLLTPNEWESFTREVQCGYGEDKYILAYVLNYAFNVIPYIYELIEYIHKNTGYKILYIGSVPSKLKNIAVEVSDIGPKEFVSLFKNASFVVTSSFHGTAFALNFGVPFYTVVDNDSTRDDRQLSLLNSVGANARALTVNTDFSTIEIEYNQQNVNKNIIRLRKESIDYLSMSLSS